MDVDTRIGLECLGSFIREEGKEGDKFKSTYKEYQIKLKLLLAL